MLFHFGDIVRNIIDHVEVQVIRCCVEDLGKSLREEVYVSASQNQLFTTYLTDFRQFVIEGSEGFNSSKIELFICT